MNNATLNQMGYSSESLDSYQEAFINYANNFGGPVLDIGAGFGTVTIPLIENGIQVIANDVEERHLQLIKAGINRNLHPNLNLMQGYFPDDLHIPESSLTGVILSKVLHFLSGDKIELGISAIHKWLKPEGKIVITATTPYSGVIKEFIPVFEARKRDQLSWPGEVINLKEYCNHKCLEENPTYMNFLDEDILLELLTRSGFVVEKFGYFPTANTIHEDFKYDGRESIGVIGRKVG